MIHIAIVQYAGDYREAYQRLLVKSGGEGQENFYAQKHSVEAVANLGRQFGEVITLCYKSENGAVYDEFLAAGVRAIGFGFTNKINDTKVIACLEEIQPTHLILRTPSKSVFRWGIRNNVKILALLADSFSNKNIRSWWSNFQLKNLLNHPNVTWVGNCNVPASLTLKDIGVNGDKIIPWEWPATRNPHDYKPKTLTSDRAFYQLFYAGQVNGGKGVDDLLQAISILHQQNFAVKLKIAGNGNLEAYRQKCQNLGVSDRIEFLGMIPNPQVFQMMQEADAVVVPSRPEYPEGFPKTVVETLCSRTPLIASNHPVFNNILDHDRNALVFPAGNAKILASEIQRLLTNAELYHQLSVNSTEAWQKLQLPVKWLNLIEQWLVDSPDNYEWLYQHRLSSGLYD
ncbi:MAG: glycosyltransferase family 4 protein [Spirulinaceae cyanobacterium]